MVTPQWNGMVPDQTGRFALVTGANAGLGFRVSEALVRAGAHTILACRNESLGRAAVEKLRPLATGFEPELIRLDLADLSSVRAAAALVEERVARLDLLVNNAGVLSSLGGRTSDGFEIHLGTNHLGPFALTGLLLPALLRSEQPRVVATSSLVHWLYRARGDIDWTAVPSRAEFAYSRSKLANLLFALELDRRARHHGSGLLSAASHPGWVTSTGLVNDALFPRVMGTACRPLTHDDIAGSHPQLYAATMPDVQGGEYVGPRWASRGRPHRARMTRSARDEKLASDLWTLSRDLTGVTYSWPVDL